MPKLCFGQWECKKENCLFWDEDTESCAIISIFREIIKSREKKGRWWTKAAEWGINMAEKLLEEERRKEEERKRKAESSD